MSCVCSIIESGEMGFKNSFLIVPEDLPPMIITLFFLSYYFSNRPYFILPMPLTIYISRMEFSFYTSIKLSLVITTGHIFYMPTF